jgi:hypothetical protein
MADWIVKLTDEDGKAVTDADVSLVRESELSTGAVVSEVVPRKDNFGVDLPLMAHDADGTYRLPAPLSNPADDWRLIVRKDRRHTVIQPVAIADSSRGGFATTPRNLDPKGPVVEVSAVEIKTVHAGGTSTTTFLVRQLPHAEVVLVSGTQFTGAGEPLRTFAEGRRDALVGAKVASNRRVDDGTLVTLWSLDDRATLFFARARGATLGWVLVHRVQKSTAPVKPITPGAPWPKKPDRNSHPIAIHCQEIYAYLHAIGSARATRGRVREVSIFSHAFSDGPILYNTNDRSTTVGQRDPDDFDCRAKDWELPTSAPFDKIAKAMSNAGRWHIWGCNTNPELVALTASANLSRKQKRPDDELFVVNHRGKNSRYEARVDRRRVLRRHLEWLASRDRRDFRSYPGMAVAPLGCDVFAALPGTWANFSTGKRSMFVSPDEFSWPIIERYHEEEPELKAVFKPTTGIDGERYVDYRLYAGMVFPSVSARSAEYEFWSLRKQDRFVIAFHGGQLFGGTGDATVRSERLSDVGAIVSTLAGKAGHRYVLEKNPDTETTAVLVVETGSAVRVFRLKRGSSGAFDIQDSEIPAP